VSVVSALATRGTGRQVPLERRLARLEHAMTELRRIAGDEARPHPALADALGAFADDVVRTRARMRPRGALGRSAALAAAALEAR
jgi:hypothetical protein